MQVFGRKLADLHGALLRREVIFLNLLFGVALITEPVIAGGFAAGLTQFDLPAARQFYKSIRTLHFIRVQFTS
jgi:hypothetical protein